jgi:hypothetical protein
MKAAGTKPTAGMAPTARQGGQDGGAAGGSTPDKCGVKLEARPRGSATVGHGIGIGLGGGYFVGARIGFWCCV